MAEEKDGMTESRLTAIEMKLTYMEDFLKQLQEVTVANGGELGKLHEEARLMAGKIREMSDLLEGDIPNRKPPHY